MTSSTVTLDVENLWRGAWSGPCRLRVRGRRVELVESRTQSDGRGDLTVPGCVFAGMRDAHVHLDLVEARDLYAGGLSVVHDLGSALPTLAPFAGGRVRAGLPEVRFAGQFLTAAGGYPSDRTWARAGSVRAVTGPADAAAAVDEQARAGADFVKVMLNADAGPTLDEATLGALVRAAHEGGRRVVAHAEGTGQVERAFAAGVDRLAHAPWTERLSADLLGAMGPAVQWISTLDIHGRGGDGAAFEVAVDNVRRFRAAGGTVIYGTDQGNGPQRVGVNDRELLALLAAGLDRAAVLDAIALAWPARCRGFAWAPGPPPSGDQDWARWVASVRNVAVEEWEEQFG
ncbi:hypothetical protein [Rhodococcus sp. NPDC127528]|uniref:hypothetical protein n=1 Tax=unclassified Rhodococcus (in: high G+C Gram-positive bacteria) TaxID=192944 RepID=UPI0036453762